MALSTMHETKREEEDSQMRNPAPSIRRKIDDLERDPHIACTVVLNSLVPAHDFVL